MDELDMIKALAELEGINLTSHRGILLRKDDQGYFYVNGVTMGAYNPLTSLELTYQAMIKYNVRIMGHKIYIDSMRNKSTVVNENINNPLSVAKSIIECILKHNNLWSEK